MHDTQITINLGGQDLILSFNNYAMAEIGNVYGIDPLEANKKLAASLKDNYVGVMPVIIWAGIIGYSLSQGIFEPSIMRQSIFQWVGDAQEDELEGILQAWNKYRYCVEERNKITPVAKKKEKK